MLPIHAVLEPLKAALAAANAVVLAAPPGAGKTTVVPLALLDQPWLAADGGVAGDAEQLLHPDVDARSALGGVVDRGGAERRLQPGRGEVVERALAVPGDHGAQSLLKGGVGDCVERLDV